MRGFKFAAVLSGALFVVAQQASAAVVHAGAPVSVPVDSPFALGSLAVLVSVVAARALAKRKR